MKQETSLPNTEAHLLNSPSLHIVANHSNSNFLTYRLTFYSKMCPVECQRRSVLIMLKSEHFCFCKSHLCKKKKKRHLSVNIILLIWKTPKFPFAFLWGNWSDANLWVNWPKYAIVRILMTWLSIRVKLTQVKLTVTTQLWHWKNKNPWLWLWLYCGLCNGSIWWCTWNKLLLQSF